MSKRIIVEETCEHGQWDAHWVWRDINTEVYCGGMSRRQLVELGDEPSGYGLPQELADELPEDPAVWLASLGDRLG